MRTAGLLILAVACGPTSDGDRPDAGEPTADALIDAPAAATCEHAFRLDGHTTASSVWLTGTFTGWATSPGGGAIEFTQGVDGAWTGSHVFALGTHHYKFIIDGSTWITDPTNLRTADDGTGNINSVYVCLP